jgi:hypothetical protein
MRYHFHLWEVIALFAKYKPLTDSYLQQKISLALYSTNH